MKVLVFKRTVLTVFDKGIESLQQTQIFNPLYLCKPEAEFKEPRLDAVQIRDNGSNIVGTS